MTPNAGDTYDSLTNPGFVTDDSAQQAAPPDPPDFARIIPISAIQDAKQQQVADQWMQQQQADLADQWYSLHKNDLDSMVQDWQNGLQTGGGAASLGAPQAPETAAPPTEASSDQASASAGMMPSAEQPPQPPQAPQNDVIQQFLGGLGDLVDRIKGSGAAQALGPHPELGQAAQNLPGYTALEQHPIDLTGGNVGGEVAGLAGATTSLPSIPGLTGAAQFAESAIAPLPSTGLPVGTEVAPKMAEAMTEGLPQMAGAGETIAREALTADHPIVQQAAELAPPRVVNGVEHAVTPEAVANVIQSKSFDPAALEKASGRISSTETAALDAWKVSQDPTLAQAAMQRAGASGTEAGQATAGEALPGPEIFDKPNLPAPNTPTPSVTEPSVENLAQAGMSRAEAEANLLPSAPKNASPNLLNAWQQTNKALIRLQMADPLYHDPNLLSEAISTYFPDVRALGGIKDDIAFAQSIKNDAAARAALKDEAPNFRLFSDYSGNVGDVSRVVNNALNNLPVIGGVKSGFDWLSKSTFQGLGDTVQLMAYNAARRSGNSPTVAGKIANAEVGAFTNADRNGLMKGISDNLAFAGKWLQGTGVQLGSVFGNPTFGGFAKDLTPAERSQLATALRGQFLKSLFNNLFTTNIINHVVSGHWSFQNPDPGHQFDIDTGHQDANGKEIYVTSPFFRRTSDVMHLLSIPGTPLSTMTGTTTLATLNNKLNPLSQAAEQVAPGIGQGAKYMVPSDQNPGIKPGPPIFTPGADTADKAKEAAAFAFNVASPVQVNASAPTRSPEGIKLQNPQLEVGVGPNLSADAKINPIAATVGQLTGARLSSGPRDLGTKEEYFQHQEDQVYGDSAKPFRNAGVQLSTGPNGLSAGTGSKKVSIPTTDADEPIFQAAYKQVLDAGLKQYGDKANKAVLTAIEQKAFSAGKAAVEKTLTKDEVQRRIGVAQAGAPSAATAFWKSGAGGSSVPSSTPSRPASSGGQATAFWKKAS